MISLLQHGEEIFTQLVILFLDEHWYFDDCADIRQFLYHLIFDFFNIFVSVLSVSVRRSAYD